MTAEERAQYIVSKFVQQSQSEGNRRMVPLREWSENLKTMIEEQISLAIQQDRKEREKK